MWVFFPDRTDGSNTSPGRREAPECRNCQGFSPLLSGPEGKWTRPVRSGSSLELCMETWDDVFLFRFCKFLIDWLIDWLVVMFSSGVPDKSRSPVADRHPGARHLPAARRLHRAHRRIRQSRRAWRRARYIFWSRNSWKKATLVVYTDINELQCGFMSHYFVTRFSTRFSAIFLQCLFTGKCPRAGRSAWRTRPSTSTWTRILAACSWKSPR